MIPDKADVAVIGSGPSGSMAAGLLAKAGFDVVILEREAHPRLRVGESVVPDFWKFSDLLGATDDLIAAQFVRKAGAVVEWDGQVTRMRFKDFGYERPALHVDRDEFDHILVGHAQRLGAQLFENVTVRNVDFGDQWHLVYYTGAQDQGHIAVRYVIDASGQSGVLARQLGTRVINPDFRFMSVWGYFENARYYDYDRVSRPHSMVQEIPPATSQISLREGDHIGWSWHIALRSTTSVGCVLPRETVASLKLQYDNWEERFDHLMRSEPALHHLMEGATLKDDKLHFINNFSGHSTEPAGHGYFQIGDAAGFFDPLFSIGITLAMYSGSLAAWAAGECLRKPQHAQRYQDLFRKQTLGRLELARGLALPHYGSAELQEDRAAQSLAFNSDNMMDLINTVSQMSKRGTNLDRLLK